MAVIGLAEYLSKTMDDINYTNSLLQNYSRSVPFQVPEDYFEKLTESVMVKVLTATIDKKLPYTLPQQYFDLLPLKIVAFIRGTATESATFYPEWSIPNNYFEGLGKNVLTSIHAAGHIHQEVYNELETLSPLLNKIPKNVYQVPSTFFAEIKINPINSTLNEGIFEKPTKQTPIRKLKKWRAFAAAACILTMILTAGFWFYHFQENKKLTRIQIARIAELDIDKSISDLSDTEIQDILEEQSLYSIHEVSAEPVFEEEIMQLIDNTDWQLIQ